MTGLALLLLICAAFFHATWNFISKKTSGGAVFVWLFNVVASIIYIPVVIAVLWITKFSFNWDYIIFMLGSAVIHVGYFLLLNKGYNAGDLSLVYPLARGTGPLLSTLAAIFFLGEHPSFIALAGTLFIAVGVFLLLGNPAKYAESKASSAILFAIFTGFFIAGYTLWDKYAVSNMAVPPILLYWGATVGQALLMLPYALKKSRKHNYTMANQPPFNFWCCDFVSTVLYSCSLGYGFYAGELCRPCQRSQYFNRGHYGSAVPGRRRC